MAASATTTTAAVRLARQLFGENQIVTAQIPAAVARKLRDPSAKAPAQEEVKACTLIAARLAEVERVATLFLQGPVRGNRPLPAGSPSAHQRLEELVWTLLSQGSTRAATRARLAAIVECPQRACAPFVRGLVTSLLRPPPMARGSRGRASSGPSAGAHP